MGGPKSRLTDLFEHASAQQGPELERFLAGLRREDPALADELEQLLEFDARGGPLGSNPRFDPREGEGEPAPTSEFVKKLAEVSPPASRYTIHGEIDRGGQGAILRVWDETLRRPLAMKVVLGSQSALSKGPTPPVDARSLGRFLEEAQVTGQLDHPGVVPVHELAVNGDGAVYFTMRLVKGASLGEIFALVRAGKDGWNQTRAVSAILKVCETMSYAHSKGVIHRDLKPGNVMVGKYGEVYVMDWGLAKVRGRKDEHDLRLRPANTASIHSERADQRVGNPDSPLVTMDGTVMGTPAFMSPEQAEGRVEELGPRSDVYGVGAMLYQLLTGQEPYVPPGARPSPHVIVAAVLSGPPKPIHALNPEVPAELTAICEKAMARRSADRYADMQEMADDLRAYLEHRVVRAYETGSVAELRKWVVRNSPLAASIAAAFVLLAAGLTTSLVFKEHAEARASEVMRLSALQVLDGLEAEADRLWPASIDIVPRYESWLERAGSLVSGLPNHEAKLSELRARALPWSDEDRARYRATHPRLQELETAKRRLEHFEPLRLAQESSVPPREPSPAEVGVDLDSLPTAAGEINALAWGLVDPDRKEWGEEAKGLVLARRALELATDLTPSDETAIRDTLAWALFANGWFHEALDEERRALASAPSSDWKRVIADQLDRLSKEIEDVATLGQRTSLLEVEISARPEWLFADEGDQWWHDQLAILTGRLKALSDDEVGLASDGISHKHGWGIRRRASFARTIDERSVDGLEASAKWSRALASISNPVECPAYGGLKIPAQLGLLPIGRDPDSGLWEFAHLQTGEPAQRGSDGKVHVTEDMGLVFVLLPGGTFSMGAQASDPGGRNHDPQTADGEAPVHDVTLSPFFISKYEWTQGQWLRIVGSNPSLFGPHNYNPTMSHTGEADLAHPVHKVSWYECVEVCRRLGLLLPSEAQWEYAARAGSTTVWWTGNEKTSLSSAGDVSDRFARASGGDFWGNHEMDLDDGHLAQARVGTYRANPFGLYDVVGNLWEWCRDGYQRDYYRESPGTNPARAPTSSSRTVRGGSWRDTAADARSASRVAKTPEQLSEYIGLRPVMEVAR